MNNFLSETELITEVDKSTKAFKYFAATTLHQRFELLIQIAEDLKKFKNNLIGLASEETNLSFERLEKEFDRTIFQLKSYAAYAAKGNWLNIKISKSNGKDIRKMNIPLGPIVVFGSSNFPFAYSTPGGDTASALAAGCCVIIKAHPAHIKTSSACAGIITDVIKKNNFPEGIFRHVNLDMATTQILVKHPAVKAVAFTGSFSGGKQIFDWGNEREVPIPVFAEMGSENPIFLLPEILLEKTDQIADKLFSSITTSVGQFCTNPGLLIAIKSKSLKKFEKILTEKLNSAKAENMLHAGIAKNFHSNRKIALQQNGLELLTSERLTSSLQSIPTLAKVSSTEFINNKQLHEEVFGPFSIIVECENEIEMNNVAKSIKGQLTCTVFGTNNDLRKNSELTKNLQQICGRFVINDVPTGVEVCLAMQHGGPFPATTDSRFTAVGGDAILRFCRPLTWQNCPEEFLPQELRDDNPLNLSQSISNSSY